MWTGRFQYISLFISRIMSRGFGKVGRYLFRDTWKLRLIAFRINQRELSSTSTLCSSIHNATRLATCSRVLLRSQVVENNSRENLPSVKGGSELSSIPTVNIDATGNLQRPICLPLDPKFLTYLCITLFSLSQMGDRLEDPILQILLLIITEEHLWRW